MTLASFISSGTSHAILNGFAFFAFVLWLALGFWTYKDAKRRIEDPIIIAVAAALMFVGLGFKVSAAKVDHGGPNPTLPSNTARLQADTNPTARTRNW